MKNIANLISISRIIMSLVLLITKSFSISFIIIYIYCGLSDILDGIIAIKTNSDNYIGSIIDSIADMVFIFVVLIKILPILNPHLIILIWIIDIVIIKIINIICSFIYYKKLVLPHTYLNKITGIVLFISVLLLSFFNNIIVYIIVCFIATIAVLQEGHLIRTKSI